MRKDFIATLIVIAIFALGTIAYASVAVKQNGVQIGTAEAINNIGSPNPYSQDGFNMNVNWTGFLQAGNVNWTSFHALDASYGSHSGINWQSLGA